MGADTFTVEVGRKLYTAPLPTRRAFMKWGRHLEKQGRKITRTVKAANDLGSDPGLEGAINVGRRMLKVLREVGVDIPEEVAVKIPLEELEAGVLRAASAIAKGLNVR